MDSTLRCNSLKCRQRLSDRAVVTTCRSVIHCLSDVRRLSTLTATYSAYHARILSVFLVRQTDFASVPHAIPNLPIQMMPSLHSSIPPKTTRQASSAGLVRQSSWSAVAVDCHSTSIRLHKRCKYSGFVSKNKPDESSMYHDFMAKNLADRYANLNSQMDNVIKDANSEISGLRDRLESEMRCVFKAGSSD
jgi:E3 ubiquitin-protein ligase CCNP1IP1